MASLPDRFPRPRWLALYAAVLLLQPVICQAAEPSSEPIEPKNWPQEIVVTVGDIRTRVAGPNLWTLSGIDFQGTAMSTEDSAYGTVLTIRNVGHLGTAHFLDVPGKPGQVEKEHVESLKLFMEDEPVRQLLPTLDLKGRSFRMERKSKIRTLDLATSISIRDGALIETAHLKASGSMDLQVAYPWMYAFTHQATHYVFGDDTGIRKRGAFRREGKPSSEVVKGATWIAVFDPERHLGAVCCFVKHPPTEEGSFLLVDAPGVYRKVAAYSLVDTIISKGFAGTYQSALGFFRCSDKDWEGHANERAVALKTQATAH